MELLEHGKFTESEAIKSMHGFIGKNIHSTILADGLNRLVSKNIVIVQ
jgi:hypothetical protein